MDKCNDEDLRKRLKVYGQDVGPINDSTRPYWQRALSKLQFSVSPVENTSSSKRVKVKTPLRLKKNGTTCRSRSVDSPIYTDKSLSEEECLESDNDSILTDSPGNTPFPTKVPWYEKLCTNKTISSIETTECSQSIRNRKKSRISMTPIRNSRVKYLDKKSTQTQQGDRELREKLKEYGEYVPRDPMNETTRNEWNKRLNKLMSLGQNNSDSEIIYPSTYRSRRRKEPRNETFGGTRTSSDEGNEDSEYFEDCIQNDNTSKWHLSECLKSFFTLLLRGIVCIVVIIVGILLLGETSEEGETNVPEKLN